MIPEQIKGRYSILQPYDEVDQTKGDLKTGRSHASDLRRYVHKFPECCVVSTEDVPLPNASDLGGLNLCLSDVSDINSIDLSW
jgi:hypothetical protein